jgi:ribosomal protein S18 acetylase RimI-like enzyme
MTGAGDDATRLRPATAADAAVIGAVHVAAWRETYRGIVPDAMLAALSVEGRSAMWRAILDDPAASGAVAVFVAEIGGTVIGFGSCGRQRDDRLAQAGFDGEIGAIYLLRAGQYRGIGRALMAAMAQTLAHHRHRAAALWVLRDNAPARGFYERLSGVIVGERSDERPDATLVELAYGWHDLARLGALAGAMPAAALHIGTGTTAPIGGG